MKYKIGKHPNSRKNQFKKRDHPKHEFKKGHICWNKGLNKSNDKRINEMSLKMKGRPSKRKSKTYEEIFGKEKSEEIRKNKSFNCSGKRNHRYGLKVSEETRIKMKQSAKGHFVSKNTRLKIGKANKGKIKSKENIETMRKRMKKIWNTPAKKDFARERRKKQIFPLKDTKIELKIQDFLTGLKIEFITHKYMNIKHAYQCDIFIPIQKEIIQKTIIECDGDFYHMNPNKFSPEDKCFVKGITAKEKWKLDDNRTKELIENGFRVIRLWGSEINKMNLEYFKNNIITTTVE